MTTCLLATGTILLAVGLTLSAWVAEWFAAFDACLPSASCAAPSSVTTFGWFLGLLALGVLIAVVGAVSVGAGLSRGPESGPTTRS